jgi:membrane-bound lytic murein transglycosylase D
MELHFYGIELIQPCGFSPHSLDYGQLNPTLMPKSTSDSASRTSAPPLRVTLEREGVPELTLHFRDRFLVGSGQQCDVTLTDPDVSATHAEIYPENGKWYVRDCEGTSGTFMDGRRITVEQLREKCQVLFGTGGVILGFEVGEAKPRILSAGLRTFFQRSGFVAIGEHKAILLRAISGLRRVQKRKYLKYIVALGVIGLGAAIFAYIQNQKVQKQEEGAREIFYQMKELELVVGRLQMQLSAHPDSASRAEASLSWAKLRELNASYEKYISDLGVYGKEMTEAEKAIYRTARVFGECELTMPKEFVSEVKNYIGLWKRSDRLARALRRAQSHGYTEKITHSLLAVHMPPQFFYLALQESEFDTAAIGPPTRFGIAKGMWQFIPATALQYGLRTGPLVQLPRMDPRDDRHRAGKANDAAAKYLRDIYNGEAQASGLLVIASYNWGHNMVRGLIRNMPENPRERNFWKFLATYKDRIPHETYDYVFYIVSAAVIGENPGLFGFSFDNPLPAP